MPGSFPVRKYLFQHYPLIVLRDGNYCSLRGAGIASCLRVCSSNHHLLLEGLQSDLFAGSDSIANSEYFVLNCLRMMRAAFKRDASSSMVILHL